MSRRLALAFAMTLAASSLAHDAGVDPYLLTEDANAYGVGYRNTTGLSPRPATINPAQRTLVLISAGQSNRANMAGALYIPANNSSVDNLNIYDGYLYPISGPLLGTQDHALGPGNMMARVADLLVKNHRFDRVILVPVAISGTKIAVWGTGGILHGRMCVAMRRLADLNITPQTPGVTFAMEWGQGESDNFAATSQESYQTSWNQMISTLHGCNFSGRIFIALQSYYKGTRSTAVRAAQAAVVDKVTIFQSGDLDTLESESRQDDVHFSASGAASAAILIYNAMLASGPPF